MSSKVHRRISRKPRVVGVGLVALDVIFEVGSSAASVAAGGTCGNVMTILSRLGWDAVPIGRFANDPASSLVLADLQRWGVDTSQMRLHPTAKTPVIVERIRKDASGLPFHTFSFACPGCGKRLPSFQAVTTSSIASMTSPKERPEVVFIDRVSRSSLVLAESASKRGAVVYFEPSSSSKPGHFAEMLKLAHVIKYSHDRLLDAEDLQWKPQTLLEVQTLGRGGLRFRTTLDSSKRWRTMQAFPVQQLRDTAGCGDWLSAGLIHSICRGGLKQLQRCSLDRLVDGLSFGQGLAAWNCGFIGPRGGMCTLSSDQFRDLVRQVQLGKPIAPSIEPWIPDDLLQHASAICDSCKPIARKNVSLEQTRVSAHPLS
jgi:fructokinase